MKQTFQGIPVNFPPPTLAVVASGGALSSAGTYWFWLQGRNRQGFNQVSTSATVTVAAGDRIEVTIPATCRPAVDGSDIREILVLASTSSDPTTAVNISSRSGLEPLPAVITLSADEHLAMGLAQLVAEVEALPVSPLVGMRRQLDDWGEIREWSGSAWVRCEPQSFSTRIELIDGTGGARQSLSLVSPELVHPVAYGVDGSDSETVTYWFINDTSVAVASSVGITCTVESGGKDISSLINGSLSMAFAGYANTTTAAKDSLNADESGDMVAIGDWLDYPGAFTGLVLPKNLLPGMAYALSFRLNMSEAIARFAAYDGQLIGIRLDLEPYTAHLVPMGLFLGSLISADGGRRRLVPGSAGLTLVALPGTGVLKISQSQAYLFRERPAQAVAGLSSETTDQQVYISAQGNVFVATTPGSTSALRAVVGTVSGFGAAIAAGSLVLGPSYRLSVTVPIPTAIRADYPDAIASSADGVFNASSIRIYAKPASGNVLYWDAAIPLDEASVVLSLSAAGTSLGTDSIPTVDADFGLYSPAGAIAARVDGSSSLEGGTFEIFAAFYYSGTVTSISHSTALGCIPEADGSIADIFNLLQYLYPPVFLLGNLRAIPAEERRPLRQVFCAIAQRNYRWNPVENSSEDLDFTFRSAAGDPASGEVALDNAVPSLAVELRFHALDRDGEAIAALIDEIAIDDEIQLDAAGTGDAYARFRAINVPVLTGSIYTLQVSYLSGAGSFVDTELTVLSVGTGFIRPLDVMRSSAGRWVAEVAVAVGDVTVSEGAAAATVTNVGTTAAAVLDFEFTLEAGPAGAGIVPTGNYDGATAYAVGDSVNSGGASYVAIVPTTGNAPPNASFWQQLAANGTDGIDGAGYGGTSTTSLLIASSGSKTLTTQAGLAYLVGSRIRIASAAGSSNYMEGVVTSYSSTTLIFTADNSGGAGTFTDWNLSIAGNRGIAGSVSALPEQVSIPSTASAEIALSNVGGVLQWRLASNGAVATVASTANVATKVGLTADTGTITYAATVDLDMAALTGLLRTITLTGVLTFTSSNRASGRNVSIRLIGDASSRALTFPAGWRFLGTKPTALAASKVAVLSLTFFGAADTDCVAAYGVEAS